jgi:pimeloyl-ACP methyl ester carboxylesterase
MTKNSRFLGSLALIAAVAFPDTACAIRLHKKIDALPTRGLTLGVDGVRINYTQSLLLNDDRPTLVLIHGFGASLDAWNDIYSALAADHSVVRLDLKGAGFSDKPGDGRYAPADQARLLLRFLRALGLRRVVLVGHSLGAGIAILATLTNTQTPAEPAIEGLVLIDPAGYPQRFPFFIRILRNPVLRVLTRFESAEFKARYVLSETFAVKARVTDDRVQRYAYYLKLPGAEHALEATAHALSYGTVDEFSVQLGAIAVPTLIVWGARDPVFPVEQAAFFHRAIAGSVVSVLQESGHVPHEEQPEATLEILRRFLSSLSYLPALDAHHSTPYDNTR